MKGRFIILILVVACLYSCNEDDSGNEPLPIETNRVSISGVVQKGPFASGTNVTILELDEGLYQTGRNFFATTIGKKGEFTFPQVNLESNYVELIADGFYYNEVSSDITDDRIILKAVSSVEDSQSVNVNLLTTLTIERIKYLVETNSISFSEARSQAQAEVFNVFGFTYNGSQNFEDFDFTENGAASDQLLAISGILLDIRNNQQLTSFLAEFAFDLKEDGILDSPELNERLRSSAELFPYGQIRVNLEHYYNDGSTYETFQSFVEDFMNFSAHEPYLELDFPIANGYGINILPLTDMDTLDNNETYCVSQNLVASNPEVIHLNGFGVEIAQISGTGSYTYTLTDEYIDPWYRTPNYNVVIRDGLEYPGLLVYNPYPFQNTNISNTPVTLEFEGEGEILIRFMLSIYGSANHDGNWYIDKYFKWE